ncbi:MAG TPA: hypothetical protein DCR77_02515 [Flavobacteriaceae bacterium]|nr:hypothetical protein [Flavobacteriaceae bacterium]
MLGNKENRSNLVSLLWFNEDFKDLKKTLEENKFLDSTEWKKVQKEFENKLREIDNEKERLTQFINEYDDYILTEETLNKLAADLHVIETEYNQSLKDFERQKNVVEKQQKNKTELLNELSIIKSSKPNLLEYLFSSTKRNTYKKAQNNILTSYNQLNENLAKSTAYLQQIEKKYSELKITYFNQKTSKETLLKQLENLVKKVSEAKNELENNYADFSFWNNIETQQSQESCPWYSKKLKKLNSELFIISLKLHEVFILTANGKSSRISTTLAGFFEYLKGHKKVSKKEVKAMWDTFFLVVPVVSSAFASIQTMFKDLEQEDLPWLFIDEAGQAVPQAAAGAIWRSKRVGIVGDPFQIEPVVTIPNSITNNISQYFDLTNEQLNSELSVQSMADRINPYGTYLTIDSKKEWIGIPLRVHRRCIDPMFKIANSIAYDNSMYNSTSIPENIKVKFNTAFMDVKGDVEGRHYVQNQVKKIKEILIEEINYAKGFPDIFVITPFSEISFKIKSFLFHELIHEIRKYKSTTNNEMNEWLKSHIGTVHTFQGKQAEGVIFCLGLDDKTKSAATWASQKPNLLNVAITRAKYRFIAIGDQDIWLKQPYFERLKEIKIKE